MYIVKTQSSVNEMMLHHNNQSEYRSESLADALKVFEQEVAELAKCYTHQDELGYTPTEQECQHAIFCEVTSINEDEELETIKISDYYFEK